MELEHIGIAVRNAASALRLMEALIGERPYKSEAVNSEGVRTHFLRAGAAKLELLEALDEASPIAQHIEKRGPGLHHLAFEVDDLEATRDRLTKAGFRVLGTSRDGADGKRIFFVHPRDTAGVLYEFCRQNRSILDASTEVVNGRPLPIRRAGTKGPVSLVVGKLSVSVDALARRLEQSGRIIVADAYTDFPTLLDVLRHDAVHLIVASTVLAKLGVLEARIRSLVILVDGLADISSADRPTLVAAPPSSAAAATAMYERSLAHDLAIGSDDLIVRAIEMHIRRYA